MRDRDRIKFGTGYETRLSQTAGSVEENLKKAGQRESYEKDHDQSSDAGKIYRQRGRVAGERLFKLLHLNSVLLFRAQARAGGLAFVALLFSNLKSLVKNFLRTLVNKMINARLTY